MNNTNQIFKWAVIAGLFLITLSPLIISSSLLFPFITGKAFYFRSIVDVIFALYVILALRAPEFRPKKSWMSAVASVFLVVVFIADVFGVNPHKSIWSNFERMEGFFMILHLWMFYIVAGSVLVKKYWQHWMNTSVAVSVCIGLYGLAQLAGKIGIRQGADRLDGTLGNASYLAVYMLLNIGFALYLLLEKSKKRWAQIVYSLVILLDLFIIFKTATRGTILGIVVGVIVSAILYAWKANEDKVGRKIAIALLGLVVLSGSSFYSIKDTQFVKNNVTLNRIASTTLQNARTKYIWPIAFKGIQKHPILGYGQEGFNYVFNSYYNPKMWTEEQWFDRAHSVFIDWFIAAGVLGFGLYVALYVLSILYIWRGSFNLKEKVVLIGLVVAYAIHNLTVFDNISSYILFFAFLAFLHTHTAKEYVFREIKINKDILELVVTPLVVIIMSVVIYFVNISPIKLGTLIIDGIRQYPEGLSKNLQAYKDAFTYNVTGSQEAREQAIQNAENIIRNSKDPQTQQVFFELAQTAIKDQIAYAPLDARSYILGASFLNHVGQFDAALPLLEKAHELTPNKQSPLFELITNQLSRGKNDEAVVTAKQALDLDPLFEDAQRLYMVSLLYAGKNADFEAFFTKNLPTNLNQQLISIMIDKKQSRLLPLMLENLVKRTPKDQQLRVSLAAVYMMNGQVSLAIKSLEQAVKDLPEFAIQGNQLISDLKSGKNPFLK